jgi:hypothetical protein
VERRKAITTAAAASLTLLAGAVGITLNSGIVGASGNDGVGQLSPVSTTAPPITVYVEDPAPTTLATVAPATAATVAGVPVTAAPLLQRSGSTPLATSTAGRSQDDDRDEDEGDDERDDEREEYEGAEDDD